MPCVLTKRLGGVHHPCLASSYTFIRPPAEVEASHSPNGMKLHLDEIRGLDGDQSLQVYSKDINSEICDVVT